MKSKERPPPRAEEGRGGSIAVGRAQRDRERRAVEADLADVRVAEVVAGDAVFLIQYVLAFEREAPRLVRSRVRDAEVEQVVSVLVRDADGRVRDLGLAAVLVAEVGCQVAAAELPAIRRTEEGRPLW